MSRVYRSHAQRGALMIEVLVTIVILAIGLMGLMQMQERLQKSEVESYQRTQAMILVNDMASRITANRGDAASYVTPTPATGFLGSGMTCPTATGTLQQVDSKEWCEALQGAAETQGTSVGAMIGGRGCVEDLGGGQFMVSVVWQGLTPVAPPPAAVACAINLYDAAGDCAGAGLGDFCRRYVTTMVRIATL